MGSYEVSIPLYNIFTKKQSSVDYCLIKEVVNLWSKGIETIESCCGHNKTSGYIAVRSQFIIKMIDLGYKPDLSTESPGCFIPKSISNEAIGSEVGFCRIKAFKNGKCTLYVNKKCYKCPIWSKNNEA